VTTRTEPVPRAALATRQIASAWIALVGLAALAWWVTVAQARSMGEGGGTMGLSLLPFLGLWVLMMAAMMLPSVAPVAILWTKSIGGTSSGWGRVIRLSEFVSGYLIAWAGFGIVAFGLLLMTDRVLSQAPDAARWLGAGVLLLGGIYQLTPLKDVCLRHCRSPVGALFHYAGFRGPLRDLRVGAHHGSFCVGCCWGLMILLVATGIMNIAVMVTLAVVIFVEKLWRHGKGFARVVGVALAVAALMAPWTPWLLPGLHATRMPM
jgi:predicted metal-binding membrane protein